ncbi:MAG: hypothetical protein HUU28_03925 [Planctomycetaceae bacterium]|nr:hypothetical protein [Planctomycetaceae bacterium]
METLDELQHRARVEFVGRASVPILLQTEDSQSPWKSWGSGAWFRVPQASGPDRLFLLTAAHVVLDSAGKLAGNLFVPVSRPGATVGSDTVPLRAVGVATFVTAHDRSGPDTEHMDAVVLEVRRDLADRILAGDWGVLDSDNIGPHAASEGLDGVPFLLCGYPEQTSASGPGWAANAPVHVLGSRYDGDVTIEHGFDPDIDLLLERPDRDYDSSDAMPPLSLRGVSGALVWAIRAGDVPGIWHPRRGVVIAGHQVSATPTGYIRVRRGVVLARLIQRAAPEIADEIEARLEGRVVG